MNFKQIAMPNRQKMPIIGANQSLGAKKLAGFENPGFVLSVVAGYAHMIDDVWVAPAHLDDFAAQFDVFRLVELRPRMVGEGIH
jgi:hypothetical protein